MRSRSVTLGTNCPMLPDHQGWMMMSPARNRVMRRLVQSSRSANLACNVTCHWAAREWWRLHCVKSACNTWRDTHVVCAIMPAVDALCENSAIDTLLSNFILPLQSDDISTVRDGKARVHCSLNINTETGRLSARRPNLQNQPALEKDRYKVTSAQYFHQHWF